MKKRIISVLLCLVMAVGLLSVPVFAAELPFTDVKTDAWYYNDVKIAYEGGLINGKSETVFDPDANLTYAEAVKLAACMHQKSTTGEVTLKNGDPWYQSYVDYCRENGIIGKDKTYEWNTKATRAGYMAIFAYALPDEDLSAVNSVADGSIPDVPMSYPEAKETYKLYRAGILQGVNSKFSCNPDANIKRCEVAAILTRMMNKDKRLSFTIDAPTTLTITEQPHDVTVKKGGSAEFTVEVTGGKKPYTYVWYDTDTGNAVSGLNENRIVNSYVTTFKGYYCVITDADGNSVTSRTAMLIEDGSPLTITEQPQDVTAEMGGTATLNVTVSGGKEPYKYEWYYSIEGIIKDIIFSTKTNDSTVFFTKVITFDCSYYCVITDADGNSVTSRTAKLIEKNPLTITEQPQDVEVEKYGSAEFTVKVSGGKEPYTYQWYTWSGGRLLNGGTSNKLANIIANSFIGYYCVITDADGKSVTSRTAMLIEKTAPLTITGQPTNASVSAGTKVVMSVTVSGGKTPYTYTWERYSQGRWETISNSSDAWAYVGDTLYIMAYRNTWMVNESIHCVVKDANGNTVTSNNVSISLK